MTNPLVAFLTALQSDPALKARLQEALPETADDVPARVKTFAAAEGYAVSDDDLAALAGALERQGSRDGDARVLSDSEADEVSGGVLGALCVWIARDKHNSIRGGAHYRKPSFDSIYSNVGDFFDISKPEFWIGGTLHEKS